MLTALSLGHNIGGLTRKRWQIGNSRYNGPPSLLILQIIEVMSRTRPSFQTGVNPINMFQAGKSYWRGRLSMVDLLSLTRSDQLLLYWRIFFTLFDKTSCLNEEVKCTEPSPSVNIPRFYLKWITTLSVKGLTLTFSIMTLGIECHYAVLCCMLLTWSLSVVMLIAECYYVECC